MVPGVACNQSPASRSGCLRRVRLDCWGRGGNSCTMTQVRKSRRGPGKSAGVRARTRAGDAAGAPPASPRLAAASAGPLDTLLDPELFRALCDPTRASITACLCKCSRACSVSEIAECCRVDLSVVSRHLALLERAGVLESTKNGRSVSYRVRYQALVTSFRALASAIEVCALACSDEACCGTEGCGPESTAGPAARPVARPATRAVPTTRRAAHGR